MDSAIKPAAIASDERQKVLFVRMFWFFVGAGASYLLISTPFKFLRNHTQLPIFAISACSLGVSTIVFFFWNYFVNFRTDVRKRDALARYLVAVTLMWVLSSFTLTFLKHLNFGLAFHLGRFPLDLDIIATQVCLGGFKFFLYHKWAFPHRAANAK